MDIYYYITIRNICYTCIWIDLFYYEYEGTIPSELGQLSALTDLSLHSNSLEGIIILFYVFVYL